MELRTRHWKQDLVAAATAKAALACVVFLRWKSCSGTMEVQDSGDKKMVLAEYIYFQHLHPTTRIPNSSSVTKKRSFCSLSNGNGARSHASPDLIRTVCNFFGQNHLLPQGWMENINFRVPLSRKRCTGRLNSRVREVLGIRFHLKCQSLRKMCNVLFFLINSN